MTSSNKYRVVFEASIDTKSLQKQVDKLSDKKINLGAKQAQKDVVGLTGRIGDAIRKTLEWAIATGAVYTSLQQLNKGIQFISDLDESMTNIQIVTGKTDTEIKNLAIDFNKLAKELSATTLEVSEGSLEWFRQGKTVAEAQELVRNSIMASKLANMESAEATEYLTSIINGFKLEADEVTGVLDKLVAVDNESATSVAELAEALKRSSNSARQAGVDFDNLVAYIATVSSVTRRSAGSIGESFKTLFARMQNLKLGNLDEMGTSVSDVELVLQKFTNTTLFDANGEFRELDTVIEELAGQWDTLGRVEQSAIAKAVAGVRQRENFLVLMNNFNDVLGYQEIQLNSAGLALDRYGIYQDSVKASLDELTASWEELWMETVEGDSIQWFYDLSSSLIEIVTSMGGLVPLIYAVVTAWALFNAEMVMTNLNSLYMGISNLIKILPNLITYLQTGSVNMAMFSTAQATWNAITASSVVQLGALAGAVYAVVRAYQAYKEAVQTVEEAQEGLSNAYDNMYSKIKAGGGGAEALFEGFQKGLDAVSNSYDNAKWYAKLFIDENELLIQNFQKFNDALLSSDIGFQAYKDAILKALEATGLLVDEEGRVYEEVYRNGMLFKEYTGQILPLTRKEYEELTYEIEQQASAVQEEAQELYELKDAFSALNGEIGDNIALMQKQQNGEFAFEDLEALIAKYENWTDLISLEGDIVRLNTDALRDMNLERARATIEGMKQNATTEKEIEVLDAYLSQLERSIPKSKDYVENMQTLLMNVAEIAPEYGLLAKNMAVASEQFQTGQVSMEQYNAQLLTLTDNLDMKQMFSENSEAGEMFFAGLTENATQSLQHIVSMFNAGEITFSQFTSQLNSISDVFVRIGDMASGMAQFFGMSIEEGTAWEESIVSSTNNIADAQLRLAQLQELNTNIEQIRYQKQMENLQFGSEAYIGYMQQIANMAVASGMTITDLQGNVLQSTDEIFNYLVANEGNFVNFSDQVANTTGNTVHTLKTNIGQMLVDLGTAIQGFQFDIMITPELVGFESFSAFVEGAIGSIFGDSAGVFTLPSLKLGISGGEQIGQAIAGYGQSLMSAPPQQLNSSVYTPLQNQLTNISSGGAGSGASDYLSNAINNTNELSDSTRKLKDDVEAYRRAQIQALEDQKEAYDEVIDKRLKLLDTMKAERSYQDELAEKTKSISDLQAEILDLSLDDTEEAKAKKQLLEEQLADKVKELETFQFEHGVDEQKQALEDERARFEKEIDDKIRTVSQIQATTIEEFARKLSNAIGYIPTDNPTPFPLTHLNTTDAFINNRELQKAMYEGVSTQNVDYSNLMGRMGTPMPTPENTGWGGGMGIEKLIEINVAGNLDESVIPDIESIAKLVFERINDAMSSRGFVRRADSYSI